MAPGASLISLKVLGADGTGYVSDVIGAIDWAIANKNKFGIRVINLSLGAPSSGSYGDDPMAKAVERAVNAGIVVIASGGNLGKLPDGTPLVGAIVSPGYTPGALTVGALNNKGTVAGRTMELRLTARAVRWAIRRTRLPGRSSRTWSRRVTRLRRRALPVPISGRTTPSAGSTAPMAGRI